MLYLNLPGTQVSVRDGGLANVTAPKSKACLVIGTSGQGPVNLTYRVTDRSSAANTYGFSGSLIKAMEEVQGASDNVILFRMGTAAAILAGIGATSAAPGITVTFEETRTATVGSDYKVWYGSGVLYVWDATNTLIYSNDSAVRLINTGDISIAGTAISGLTIGAQSGNTAKTVAGALTLFSASSLSAAGGNNPPVFTAAVTGLGMTSRQIYVALKKAFAALDNTEASVVYVPDAVADNPNVAFYSPANAGSPTAAESINDPSVTVNALGWLKTTIDPVTGLLICHWANDTNDSNGTVVTSAPFTFTVATNVQGTGRIDKGYYEVNFPYLIAKFCTDQSTQVVGCKAAIGFQAPTDYGLKGTRTFVGRAPVVDPITGRVTSSGSGLLGFVYTQGLAQASLHTACKDAGGSRSGGLFSTLEGEYDGTPEYDKNQYPIDLGSHLIYAADWAYVQNAYGSYPTSIAGPVAGVLSKMDDKESLTNYKVNLTLIRPYNRGYLDALTKAKINMLRNPPGANNTVLLHGYTGAMNTSDYTQLIRLNCQFRVSNIVRQEAEPFIGKTSTDGLQLQSLLANLRSRFTNEVKAGYLAVVPTFSIHASNLDQKLGQAQIDVTFVPPAETIRLFVSVGVQRQ